MCPGLLCVYSNPVNVLRHIGGLPCLSPTCAISCCEGLLLHPVTLCTTTVRVWLREAEPKVLVCGLRLAVSEPSIDPAGAAYPSAHTVLTLQLVTEENLLQEWILALSPGSHFSFSVCLGAGVSGGGGIYMCEDQGSASDIIPRNTVYLLLKQGFPMTWSSAISLDWLVSEPRVLQSQGYPTPPVILKGHRASNSHVLTGQVHSQ